jgi:hypothetical protein
MRLFKFTVCMRHSDYLLHQEHPRTDDEICEAANDNTQFLILLAIAESERIKKEDPRIFKEIVDYIKKAFESVYQLKSMTINLN